MNIKVGENMDENILGIILYFVISLKIIIDFDGCPFLNPIENYEEWEKLNWFGVAVFTLLINLFLLPYAVFYWIYKLFYWLFTVGRE